MLFRSSSEAERLFVAGREAGYFGSDDELVSACRAWLADDRRRLSVAEAGWQRVQSGHTHADRLIHLLDLAGLPK